MVRLGILLLGGALALIAPADAARLPRCAATCESCYVDGCSNVDDCLAQTDDEFETCTGKIPTIPGRCKLSSDRLHDCQARRAAGKTQCFESLRRKIQQDCRHAGAPCRIGRKGARRACDACGLGAVRVSVVPEQAGDDPGGCQRRCIRSVVGSCFDDCTEACNDNDPAALPFCQAGCRDASCTELEARCTADGDDADDYLHCCTVFGGCADDVDCTVTTTTTRVTTTSTSSTTTTVVGATTTSTRP